MKQPDPQRVVFRNAAGIVVEHHRTDRMNFDAATWVYAAAVAAHGPLTVELKPLDWTPDGESRL